MGFLTTALFIGLGILKTQFLYADEPVPEYWLKAMRTKMSITRVDYEKNEFLELLSLRNAKPEDFGTSEEELIEMEKRGFASETCRIWNHIESINRVNHKWLLDFITPVGNKFSEFEESQRAFYYAYEKAGDKRICFRNGNEWHQLYIKLKALALVNKACDELSAAQDARFEDIARDQYDRYKNTIEMIDEQNLNELVPQDCRLSDAVTLQVMRAPVHNILMQNLHELAKATENAKRAELAFSEAVKNYQANEKRTETIRLRKKVEKQTINPEGK